MNYSCYSDVMIDGKNYIELKLDLSEPAELFELIGTFTAIANQFEKYIIEEHPNLADGQAKVYVKQIKSGSIIADLVPFISPLIANMDAALIVDGFVRRYGSMISAYISGNQVDNVKKSDLKDFMGQVAAIANDPNGSSSITSAEFNQTKSSTRAAIKFDTKEASKAVKAIENQQKTIDAKAYEVFEKVLMVFWQSNIKSTDKGKRSGEKVIIEDISDKPLAIVYDSDDAESRIKHQLREGERNIYKLGFYISCRTETLRGRIVAYHITGLHDIIDLPDDD